ncbi:MAG: septum formation initiator family protein [Pseudomonadota bacterium]
MKNSRTDWATVAIVLVALTFAAYFCFSAVQGELGVLRRAEYQAEAAQLRAELDDLTAQIASMENKTQRLSDDFLDLDLLDERVRDVLGRVHKDDIVIQ